MKALLLMFLAVAVGDKRYDPEVFVSAIPVGPGRSACIGATGFWVVEEVGIDSKTGDTYAASSTKPVSFIHIIFSVYDFDLDGYYDGQHGLNTEGHECDEWEKQQFVDKILPPLCIDYRKRPDLLPRVCR